MQLPKTANRLPHQAPPRGRFGKAACSLVFPSVPLELFFRGSRTSGLQSTRKSHGLESTYIKLPKKEDGFSMFQLTQKDLSSVHPPSQGLGFAASRTPEKGKTNNTRHHKTTIKPLKQTQKATVKITQSSPGSKATGDPSMEKSTLKSSFRPKKSDKIWHLLRTNQSNKGYLELCTRIFLAAFWQAQHPKNHTVFTWYFTQQSDPFSHRPQSIAI